MKINNYRNVLKAMYCHYQNGHQISGRTLANIPNNIQAVIFARIQLLYVVQF
jgi:hypothetical protein